MKNFDVIKKEVTLFDDKKDSKSGLPLKIPSRGYISPPIK